MTLLDLRNALRIRLNDYADTGWFKDSELISCINIAKTEMETLLESNMANLSILTVAHQAEYSLKDSGNSIFRPKAISVTTTGTVATTAITEWSVVELCNLMATNPAGSEAAVPTKWCQVSGDKIRLTPTPSVAGYTIAIWGFGTSADLVSDATELATIPSSYQNTHLLDRAEYEARKMRLTNQFTVAAVQNAKANYDQFIAMTRAVKGLPTGK